MKSCHLSVSRFCSFLSVKIDKHKRGKRRMNSKRVSKPKTRAKFPVTYPTISPASSQFVREDTLNRSPSKISNFDGKEDAYWWILCLEKFFKEHGIHESLKVLKVVRALRGSALKWWMWWSRFHRGYSWDIFTTALLWIFKPEWREILPIEEEEEPDLDSMVFIEKTSLLEDFVESEEIEPSYELVESVKTTFFIDDSVDGKLQDAIPESVEEHIEESSALCRTQSEQPNLYGTQSPFFTEGSDLELNPCSISQLPSNPAYLSSYGVDNKLFLFVTTIRSSTGVEALIHNIEPYDPGPSKSLLTTSTMVSARYSALRLFANIIFIESNLMHLIGFDVKRFIPIFANLLLTIFLVFDPGPCHLRHFRKHFIMPPPLLSKMLGKRTDMLPPYLALRLDVSPPPVPRVMIVDSSQRGWGKFPAGQEVNSICKMQIELIVEGVRLIRDCPTAYSEFYKLYGLDVQSEFQRKKFETQRGVILVTELETLLASADMMKLGYFSRIHPLRHFVILVVVGYKTKDFPAHFTEDKKFSKHAFNPPPLPTPKPLDQSVSTYVGLHFVTANTVTGGLSYIYQRCTTVNVDLVMELVTNTLVKKINDKVENLTTESLEDDFYITTVITESYVIFIEGLVMVDPNRGAIFCQDYIMEGKLIWLLFHPVSPMSIKFGGILMMLVWKVYHLEILADTILDTLNIKKDYLEENYFHLLLFLSWRNQVSNMKFLSLTVHFLLGSKVVKPIRY